MAGINSGYKLRLTMIDKYGSAAAWEAEMRARASRGGKARVPKGFAMLSPEERSAAGHKGGSKSKKRGPNRIGSSVSA